MSNYAETEKKINGIYPVEDVYTQTTLDKVCEILYEMDLGGRLT